MKVLLISTYDNDIQGGATIIASRLLHAARHARYDILMAVRDKQDIKTQKEYGTTSNRKQNLYDPGKTSNP